MHLVFQYHHNSNPYLFFIIHFTPQNAAVFSARVHTLGRYVFILHYHQPLHPTYPVQVYINGGRIWQGVFKIQILPAACASQQNKSHFCENIFNKYDFVL